MSLLMTKTAVIRDFILECGEALPDAPVAYKTWGRLNASCDNVVVVCHALTGDANVEAWWGPLLGPGRVLDTDRFFVVCANVIGSPYGTVSPITINPATGKPYGVDFPVVTIRDTVALHKALMETLGVRQIALVIGGSMGAMQVLEWAFHRDYVRTLAAISVGGRHSAWCIGWSEAQRQAIYADPNWKEGRYSPDAPPGGGLSAARMMAMISYRSQSSFEGRFGRTRMAGHGTPAPFAVESYLRYQGEKLVKRFDANCYVRLTQQMDTHDVARGRGAYPDVLRTVTQPVLVIGIDSDILYPVEEQEELAANIPHAQLSILNASHGHDSFLIEFESLESVLRPWINSNMEMHTRAETGIYL